MTPLLLLLALTLAGCVSAFPDEVMSGVNRELTVGALRAAEPGTFVNQRVLVGGEILTTTPRANQTEIEVLSRRLRSNDTPERTDLSDGRFLVKSLQFLDPAVFAPGRRVTVLGTITGEEQRPLGDIPYRYPVIASERLQLWPRDAPPGPYYYDPYWPYWGWGWGHYWGRPFVVHRRHR